MGAGASSALSESVDKKEARQLAGDKYLFDEAAFDEAAVDGAVPRDTVLKNCKRKLASLSADEVGKLLDALELGKYAAAFRAMPMTGADLADCSLEDLEEVGIKFGPHRRRLFDEVAGFRGSGVPLEKLGATPPNGVEAAAVALGGLHVGGWGQSES